MVWISVPVTLFPHFICALPWLVRFKTPEVGHNPFIGFWMWLVPRSYSWRAKNAVYLYILQSDPPITITYPAPGELGYI